ncbi:multidrug resistance protein SMR [Brevibacillus agri]|uniref:Multidrug efflux SMR transporter n=1 Tax=Brevibacillus agri TaxID=51101 RepID=A0A3M8B3F4_9BACL|nr:MULTISPECIES: multidrug efflux SMR transporter [Brevibacillus]ELK42270.1 multidrug resistance protein [Brevibacillus agri BAB-2500]EJL43016.1 cation/cationic drug transporter [Brevibacillus sp. CF112]MBG9567277.1 multidrug resistance protein SMR [Brevibacillus agri]MBY0052043.1 multidrug efflux SMR transporter [Brevibacillus agri]MDN4095549.1 multidrug efflux SMR transporter [Brevibacillus agri]
MGKNWLLVVAAAMFEVMWVAGLKHADSFWEWLLTVVAILVSFAVLIYSGKRLPTSTVYAVFVGLGTAGTVIVEMAVFQEPFSWAKVGLIALLLVGIIGLKLVTHEHEGDAHKEGEVA